MFNFLVVMISPVAMANIGWRTYIIFAVLNFVFIFVLFFFYPETKGLELEQVDKIFTGGDPITRGAIGMRRPLGAENHQPSQDFLDKSGHDLSKHIEDVGKSSEV
jgi:hypothetical protein